jgi:hypothetical protein
MEMYDNKGRVFEKSWIKLFVPRINQQWAEFVELEKEGHRRIVVKKENTFLHLRYRN